MPDRFPRVVVQAADAAEVVAAIKCAKVNGLRVGVRSGGHSWSHSHVRDDGMLLDVSRLDSCTVDAERMVAVVGPGNGGSVLAADLEAQGLFFPSGIAGRSTCVCSRAPRITYGRLPKEAGCAHGSGWPAGISRYAGPRVW
jgi:FAD/FMN-containing dehydrogenase